MKKIILLSFICLFISNQIIAQKNEKKEEWRERKFTKEELLKYNGKNGMPVYVAVDGIVYDVTKSKYWKTGRHKNMHDAGTDLTYEIKNLAPKFHKGGKILEKFPKVGILEIENSTQTIQNLEIKTNNTQNTIKKQSTNENKKEYKK